MAQQISPPTPDDIERIGSQLLVAEQLVESVTQKKLCGMGSDLELIQMTLDELNLSPDQGWELQCLGLAFGRVLLAETEDFDWAVVDDEYGRDPALRFLRTDLLLFPLTMISKRVERGEQPDLGALLRGLLRHIAEVKPRFSDASALARD